MKLKLNILIKIGIYVTILSGFTVAQVNPYDSGGELIQEQAAYDIIFYDLDLQIEPSKMSVSGVLSAEITILDTLSWLVMDLDTKLTIDSIKVGGTKQGFERRSSRLWIKLATTANTNDRISASIYYHGNPRVAVTPPWDGGINWSLTDNGEYWTGVSCEGEGADVWWPCKDHPSDEADSMALHFTVPKPYYCASNGKLENIVDNFDGTHTFNWKVSTPINNYNVTMNIAQYSELTDQYQSITGDVFDLYFWVLPEFKSDAEALFPEISRQLEFFEKYFGPYPFRADKMGYAHTAYAGMEHQTVISYGEYYGSIFQKNGLGFDFILLHETAHEWWGNLITAEDWKDAWIHEGFATYAEAMYVEYLHDIELYHFYVSTWNKEEGSIPIASRNTLTMNEAFQANIYHKGALVLHTLRYLLGDEIFYDLLRKMCYPNSTMENDASGAACRLVSTDDFINLAEQLSGKELDWYFDQYVYSSELPTLKYRTKDEALLLKWETKNIPNFELPVTVVINGTPHKVDMSGGRGTIEIGSAEFVIDPDKWLLVNDIVRDRTLEVQEIESINSELTLYESYPNPVYDHVNFHFGNNKSQHISLKIYDITGRLIGTIVSDHLAPGNYNYKWNSNNYSSGMYFFNLSTKNTSHLGKLIVIK